MKQALRLAGAPLLASLVASLGQAQSTERVSIASDGTQGNGPSSGSSLSADARYVAFMSDASTLVSGDTNGVRDVFVHDRFAATTERASIASDGSQGVGQSFVLLPSISADGRYVVFVSAADNLVPSDTNDSLDVFVRDRGTGTTERVSVSSAGNEGVGDSSWPSISADGRYVVFSSWASNLVPGDTNGSLDVFVRDLQAGTTERVSVAGGGTQANDSSSAPSISTDGRHVAFISWASNLVPGDVNGHPDAFVRDRLAGTTEIASVATDGTQGNEWTLEPAISGDGRSVAFMSIASNLVPSDTNGARDVFVRDLLAGTTERVSVATDGAQGNGLSETPSISLDGRFVVFESSASNLVPGDTNGFGDVFVRDLLAKTTERRSLATGGAQPTSGCSGPSVSADGRYTTFHSTATHLIPGDTNFTSDVFVRDRGALAPTPYCFGDGSGTPCPCANDGAAAHGCRNGTFASGARLFATGTARVSADTLVLVAANSVPGAPGLFFQADNTVQGGSGATFGDGLRCADGNVLRLEVRSASTSGSASTTLAMGAAGGVSAGEVKRYQWWYRDPAASPCGNRFNLSNGLEVAWAP